MRFAGLELIPSRHTGTNNRSSLSSCGGQLNDEHVNGQRNNAFAKLAEAVEICGVQNEPLRIKSLNNTKSLLEIGNLHTNSMVEQIFRLPGIIIAFASSLHPNDHRGRSILRGHRWQTNGA